MSRLREKNGIAALMGYLASLLLSLGMSLALFRAFAPRQALWPVFPLCAGMALVFYILFEFRFKSKIWLLLGAAAALGAWGASGVAANAHSCFTGAGVMNFRGDGKGTVMLVK